jgi:hypothetical protein
MNKHETIGRLALLLGAAAHLPEGCKVLGYHIHNRYDELPPSILVEDLEDLPDGERLPLVNDGLGKYYEHAVMVRGVKVYCFARKDGDA